ncbi:hypothetical protein ILUMI_04518 [Ignelater luminosus]|uniref:Glucose-methanol-choline oxidoreductase N-terminal domain-containing protein n=1 Tax=Ignelater luminosus TaxID=2038154 RepID=A0A8K0DJM7_IGNLU|nr:hypothetical protein ILUMI_04518 [Ignelater luminosus]
MKNIILHIFTLFILVKVQDTSEKSVEYYLNLLQDFMRNASQWQEPTDSRRFFQLVNEQEESIHHGDYDFIIVGAGVAGSVLTNRLTESGKYQVLLLEAGGQENDFTEVPGFASLLIRSDFNWGYKTIPQKNSCLGFKNKQCNYHRGKAIGGSSVINFMVYVRGSKEDFNKWGSENPGWDYQNVLPYFKKSEKSSIDLEESEFHGHDGLLSVENVKYHPDIVQKFLEAVEQRGWKILDYNGKNQNGFSKLQIMTEKGKRCSAGKAFVKPAMKRENLEVLDYALGTKILIKDKKAYGVEFIRNGKKYQATASKEVIISGGTINSPQILMLSGIGPKEHLEELGIPVMQDLPVGQTLHDHQIFPALFFSTNISTNNELSLEDHIRNYLQGFGLLTTASALSGVGFESPRIKSDNPSVEYVFFGAIIDQAAPFLTDFIGMTEENWQAISKPIKGKHSWGIIPILLHPKSKGTLKLKSKNPLDFPLIDSNLFSDKEDDDTEEMLAIIKDILEISKTSAFQSIDSKYLSDPFPACMDSKHLSDDYWKCALRQVTYPILHAVATCRMGPQNDKSAVVDNKLKVYGISGLRVADASVMPFSISSHPTPTVFMIGEKASDLIREEYGDL